MGILKSFFIFLLKNYKKPDLKRKYNRRNYKKVLNLQKDPKDQRDYILSNHFVSSSELTDVSLKEFVPSIKNQGNIGACASHAMCTALEMLYKMQKPDDWIPLSERFHYYIVRSPEFMNTLPQDSGQYLQVMCRVANQVGVTFEQLCPYNTNKYNEQPSWWSYSTAKLMRIKSYYRCLDSDDIFNALINKKPVVIGIQVRGSFFNLNKNNDVYNPLNTEKVYGGHAITICGYNKDKDSFLIVNSWGTNWGNEGYFWAPRSMIDSSDLIDAWAVSL